VIPKQNLLGELGQGFKMALGALNGGRLNIAACSLGGASLGLQKTIKYMKQRNQFGKPLTDFQALQFKISDMAIKLDAARLMVHRAAYAMDQKDPMAPKYCAMAKKFATDECFDIVNQALQVHGGYGYIREYGIERLVRDLRVHQILEGTNEIMSLIVSKELI
jgi:alkylation response protein AidB-like acyl-CoA dehydrogenase